MSGIRLITAERQRQIDQENWTPEHDSEHARGELARAAMAYIEADENDAPGIMFTAAFDLWPWALKWWKPKDRISNLVRAGALIAAEIDRLERSTVANKA